MVEYPKILYKNGELKNISDIVRVNSVEEETEQNKCGYYDATKPIPQSETVVEPQKKRHKR